ncbi:putative ribosome biogenesis protein [Phaeomoniella chlamydospora]|uniref:Glutamate-rich WD repeat-containing protein 1 n=1 Tax=Phaeomoniella chlamydospora TaxID=158046 RepID=A0A0G2HHN2_PHACM|nr:putative ribosome biogenesis protein [Phaeomoniella chlamydospora]
MSKRSPSQREDEEYIAALKAGERPPVPESAEDEELEFADEFDDEFESEDEIFEAGVDGRPDEEREEEERDAMDVDQQTFIPGRSTLQAGEHLAPDTSTYEMLHTLSTPWPCLSFSIVRDNLGDNRKAYPRTVYAVAGTQAESSRAKDNELLILKLSSLSKMEKPGNETDSDSDSDSGDEDGHGVGEPILESKSIPLPSTTNRIRSFQPPPQPLADPTAISPTVTATMLENSQVLIHDVTQHLQALSTPEKGITIPPSASKPLSTLRMHKDEGYALDWQPASLHPLGRLLTGDNNGLIYSTQRTEGGGWVTDTRAFTGHSSSVEELQWSPNERNVFASASSDGTVKVWDVRSKARKPAVDVRISKHDINVMSWSNQTFHLLATGHDDGEWAVWDLRQWKPQSGPSSSGGQLKPSPVANFNFHKAPITSIEWHPTDDSVIALASADNTATLWDLAVELDDEEYGRESNVLGGGEKVPPQLLFIHHLEDGKELHWHPQMEGTLAVTGKNGFGVFKTISV